MKINKQEKAGSDAEKKRCLKKKVIIYSNSNQFPKFVLMIQAVPMTKTTEESVDPWCGPKTNNYKRQLIFWI